MTYRSNLGALPAQDDALSVRRSDLFREVVAPVPVMIREVAPVLKMGKDPTSGSLPSVTGTRTDPVYTPVVTDTTSATQGGPAPAVSLALEYGPGAAVAFGVAALVVLFLLNRTR